jgi:D-glycero-alpha-D-manno-heptose-7-phosphate kinase
LTINRAPGANRYQRNLVERAMIIQATTPNRVDLAGGTLDIFPLYIFEEFGLTINMAVDLTSQVWLEEIEEKKVVIHSRDLGVWAEAPSAPGLPLEGPLSFVARAVRFYNPPPGWRISTRNNVRKGSGLGASSALLIALSGALNHITGEKYSPMEIIDIAANLEAQSIGTMTGKQDYFPATFGGVSAIRFDVTGARREELVADTSLLQELNRGLVLTFAGEPRFSGLTNWAMVKNYLDGNQTTVSKMHAIKETALDMYHALKKGDLESFGQALGREWQNRRGLADGVTSPTIDRMIANAQKNGAIASKLCGAGGGGCLITFVRPAGREAVIKSLVSDGAELMDYRIATRGLTIETSNN